MINEKRRIYKKINGEFVTVYGSRTFNPNRIFDLDGNTFTLQSTESFWSVDDINKDGFMYEYIINAYSKKELNNLANLFKKNNNLNDDRIKNIFNNKELFKIDKTKEGRKFYMLLRKDAVKTYNGVEKEQVIKLFNDHFVLVKPYHEIVELDGDTWFKQQIYVYKDRRDFERVKYVFERVNHLKWIEE